MTNLDRESVNDADLKSAAQRVANVYAKIANEHFKSDVKIPIPVPLDFDLCLEKPKSAGTASWNLQMSLNMVLFRDNVEEFLNQIIPHEISHLAQFAVFHHHRNSVHTQGHGPEWCAIMKKLGKNPDKYHTMDVSKAVAYYKQHKKKK